MKNTIECTYWMLFILTMLFSINSCRVQDNHEKIIKELQQINSQLEERNE